MCRLPEPQVWQIGSAVSHSALRARLIVASKVCPEFASPLQSECGDLRLTRHIFQKPIHVPSRGVNYLYPTVLSSDDLQLSAGAIEPDCWGGDGRLSMRPGGEHYLSPFDGLLLCVAQFRLW